MARAGTRPPPWRDVRVLRLGSQVLFAVAVAALLAELYGNAVANLRGQGLRGGFAFLDQPAGFQITGSSFRASQTVREALLVGLRNTAIVAAAGIVLTTVVGTVVGVARLSRNALVRAAAGAYVETLRNLPPLLVIFAMFFAVVLRLPAIADPIEVGGLLVLSNRQLAVASPALGAGAGAFLALVALGLAAAAGVAWWRTRRWDRAGVPHHRLWWAAAVLLAVALPAYLALGGPVTLSRPEAQRFGITGGATMVVAFAALLAALVLYTSSHVAEIVRGSVLAVARGQSEAASALGLSEGQRLRYVVLPQAFRIAIPPIINQYLNLTKNSSLGIAIGFSELTQVTFIAIGNGNPAPQSLAVLMALYLVISLVISLVANVVNRRLQLVER